MVRLILVGTEGSVNLGFILRLAMNFDVNDIVLVNPRDIDWEEVKRFAARASVLIERISYRGDLNDAYEAGEFRVCTSAIMSDEDVLRQSITMSEYKRMLVEREGRVALVFGRESTGLTREELMTCDAVLTIPTSSRYPSMNLSHAVAVVLYETYLALGRAYSEPERRPILADRSELMELERSFSKLVGLITKDERKRARLERIFRNVIYRGAPRKVEARGLAFVLRRALRRMKCA